MITPMLCIIHHLFQYQNCLLLGQLYIIDLALRIIRQRNDNARDHMIKLRGTHEDAFIYKRHARAAHMKVYYELTYYL